MKNHKTQQLKRLLKINCTALWLSAEKGGWKKQLDSQYKMIKINICSIFITIGYSAFCSHPVFYSRSPFQTKSPKWWSGRYKCVYAARLPMHRLSVCAIWTMSFLPIQIKWTSTLFIDLYKDHYYILYLSFDSISLMLFYNDDMSFGKYRRIIRIGIKYNQALCSAYW